MADFLSILWTIVSFILSILWSLVWFILRDLISTLLWLGIAIWLGFVLRYRSFSLGSLALLRYARYAAVMMWRWVRGRPAFGAGAAPPPDPVIRTVTEYRRRIPIGYVSLSEQMNVLMIMLLILMAHV